MPPLSLPASRAGKPDARERSDEAGDLNRQQSFAEAEIAFKRGERRCENLFEPALPARRDAVTPDIYRSSKAAPSPSTAPHPAHAHSSLRVRRDSRSRSIASWAC